MGTGYKGWRLMGFFDTIRCEYPLPDPRHQDREFKTTDLNPLMYVYTITREGRLVLREPDSEIELPIHGDVRIHASAKAPADPDWVEYVVRFTNDRVEWIRPRSEIPSSPELPPPDWLRE